MISCLSFVQFIVVQNHKGPHISELTYLTQIYVITDA